MQAVERWLSWIEVERAQFFLSQAELELLVLSTDEPKPAKISLELASSPSFFLIKAVKFKLQPALSLSDNWDRQASSMWLFYCKPKIRLGPSSLSPSSFHIYCWLQDKVSNWRIKRFLVFDRNSIQVDFKSPIFCWNVSVSCIRHPFEPKSNPKAIASII